MRFHRGSQFEFVLPPKFDALSQHFLLFNEVPFIRIRDIFSFFNFFVLYFRLRIWKYVPFFCFHLSVFIYNILHLLFLRLLRNIFVRWPHTKLPSSLLVNVWEVVRFEDVFVLVFFLFLQLLHSFYFPWIHVGISLEHWRFKVEEGFFQNSAGSHSWEDVPFLGDDSSILIFVGWVERKKPFLGWKSVWPAVAEGGRLKKPRRDLEARESASWRYLVSNSSIFGIFESKVIIVREMWNLYNL